MEGEAKPNDMAKNTRGLLIYWGLPVAAMVAAIWLGHPLKTIAWLAALAWMGGACLKNAGNCRRTHCHFTGPFFLIMTVPVFLHGFGYYDLGAEGWRNLGLVIGFGNWGIWTLSERILGKYL